MSSDMRASERARTNEQQRTGDVDAIRFGILLRVAKRFDPHAFRVVGFGKQHVHAAIRHGDLLDTTRGATVRQASVQPSGSGNGGTGTGAHLKVERVRRRARGSREPTRAARAAVASGRVADQQRVLEVDLAEDLGIGLALLVDQMVVREREPTPLEELDGAFVAPFLEPA